MKLLDKITAYATVTLANPQSAGTHSDGDELGARIATARPEGHVSRILLAHTFTTTLPGTGTYNLTAYGTMDATSAFSTAFDLGISNDFKSGGDSANFNPKVGAGPPALMWIYGGGDGNDQTLDILTPYVAIVLNCDQVAGAWTTMAYLYGEN